MRGTRLSLVVATVLAICGTASPSVSAATIDVGDGGIDGLYELDVFISNTATANMLLNTSGTGALAFESTGVSGGVTGGANPEGRLHPSAQDVTGTLIYHFRAADGYFITQAAVINSLSFVAASSGDFIHPSYSTTNLPGSYVNYSGLTSPGSTTNDYATHTFAVGAQDLYLRYELRHNANSLTSRVRLFESIANSQSVGWSVNLTIGSEVPEPATLSFAAMGAALMLLRRSR